MSSTFNFRHQLQAYHVIQRSSCLEESHVKSCPGDFSSTWAMSAEPSVSLREARSDLIYAEERGFFDKPKHVHSCRQRYRPTAASEHLKNLTRLKNRHSPARFHQRNAWHQTSFPLRESLEEWRKTFSLVKYIISLIDCTAFKWRAWLNSGSMFPQTHASKLSKCLLSLFCDWEDQMNILLPNVYMELH